MSEIKKALKEVKKAMPEVKKAIPEVKKVIPEVKNDKPENKKALPLKYLIYQMIFHAYEAPSTTRLISRAISSGERIKSMHPLAIALSGISG